jgi:hypothetical protein
VGARLAALLAPVLTHLDALAGRRAAPPGADVSIAGDVRPSERAWSDGPDAPGEDDWVITDSEPRAPAAAPAPAELDAEARIANLRVVNGPNAGETYLVWKSPYLIGRHARANLRIRHEHVSVYHCRLVHRADRVWVEDLNSTNGTFVNDERIDGERALAPGDRIRVGGTVLVVFEEDYQGLAAGTLNYWEADAQPAPGA